ncbi:TonB-dependent receptor [Methylobacillus sp. Pita1]|uniref:TonB-dependent receptor n=1 Tax=Methylobacillus sp. Pita1 TaxID=3382642 RepID=UPI0038B65368
MDDIDPAGNYTITRAVRFNFKYKSQAADAGLRHAFQTGSIKHEIVLNANTSTRKRYDPAGGWRQYISLSGTGNIYDPSYTARPQNIPSADGYVKAEENKLQSFGIADTLHFLDDSVLLTLGLRRQSVEQVFSDYHKTVTTPAVGLLFKVNERVSLYGNYIEGLSAGSTAPTTAANAGEVFEPYQTKQVEAGVKLDLNGFATTIAAFQIKQPSAYTDPTTNIYSVDGEQRNQGLELNFFGEQQRNLRVLGGMTWMQGKLMETSGGINEGKTAVEVPKLVAKLGVEYDITSVPGLTLTANAIHTGKQYINQANTLSVPSWRRYDLGARYVTRIGDKPVTLRASVFNITDKVYWMGQLYRGVSDPRTVQLSATIDF